MAGDCGQANLGDGLVGVCGVPLLAFCFLASTFLASCFLAYHSRGAWHTGREFRSGWLRRTGPVPGTGRWVGLGGFPFSFAALPSPLFFRRCSFASFLSPVLLCPFPSPPCLLLVSCLLAPSRSLADGGEDCHDWAERLVERCVVVLCLNFFATSNLRCAGWGGRRSLRWPRS